MFPLLRRALDEAAGGRVGDTVAFFFRDDDAGWADDSLLALCDTFTGRAPLDLAVIPRATRPDLAHRLLTHPAMLRFHQHGYAHHNHRATGRKCEFAADRPQSEIAADIANGRELLGRLFGHRLDPMFTPPWNRCGPSTAEALVDLGFTTLSRDVGAEPIAVDGLVELPVSVDWVKYRRRGDSAPASGDAPHAARGHSLDRALADAVGRPPVGIMLHHEVTDEWDLDAVDNLLVLLDNHPAAELSPMMALSQQVMGAVT